jgi:hypothetical protein
MAWIPYADSGSLASPFDLLDDSFGSAILLSGQTIVTAPFIALDSDAINTSVLSLVGPNPLEIIDSESSISFNFGAVISPFIGGAAAAEAEAGPTQVWIG